MARNKLAGKSTGKSDSAKYYAANPEKAAEKKAYDSEFQKKDKQVQNRVESNRARRDAKKAGPVGKNIDMSHTTKGTLVKEHRSANRARNRGRRAA